MFGAAKKVLRNNFFTAETLGTQGYAGMLSNLSFPAKPCVLCPDLSGVNMLTLTPTLTLTLLLRFMRFCILTVPDPVIQFS